MDRGGRSMRRPRGGRPFIRGFYRGRKGIRRPMGNRSRTSSSRDKYEYNDNDRSDSHERSWDSPSGTDRDGSKDKHDDDNSPIRSKWDKDEDISKKNEERYSDKKEYSNSKYYRRPTGYHYRGQRRPYQNNYWDRSDRGRQHSPQSQYRVRPYHSPRSRRYSRSPDRRRSPSRYRSRSRSRSRSRTPSRSRRYSPKHRSPKGRSQSRRRSRSPSQSVEKNQAVKINSDDENHSDDFVEKLKASKASKTPGRAIISDDEYSIVSDKNDMKDVKQSNRSEYSSKGSKTPGRPELSGNDKDDYWVKSQTSKLSTKNLYSSSWDDSPVREKSVPKVTKTPGRKDYSAKDNDDYWINSSPTESKKDRSSKDLHSKKTTNKDSTTMYVQELSTSDSEPEKVIKRTRSISLTNSDKSDTPPLNTEQSNKSGNRYSQASRGSSSILKEPPPPSRVSTNVVKEPPPPSIPTTPNSLPVYNSQWAELQNTTTTYPPTTNYVQPQASQFAVYQQGSVPNSQWYQPGYQQYGTTFQQFPQYDPKSVAFNPARSNLEPVEGYQSTNRGLYNIDLKQVVDITKPPPNITPIIPVSDTQPKSSQDSVFETQRETYTTKLFSLRKELETLQIQYDKFKLDNTDGRHNNDLKMNRKLQDEVNGKIKGVTNILEVLNTMIPKDSLKEVKKIEPKKITAESGYPKTPIETLQHEEILPIHKHRRHSTSSSSSSSIELKKKPSKSNKSKKLLRVQSSSEEEIDSKKLYKSKELIDTNKKKIRNEKLPQFKYIYCDSCIHWCQPCNIFPKTAKDYLTHLHSESHKTTLEELDVVELPWHDSQTDIEQPETNSDLQTKRVPIKGLEFFIGTSAWYCKLCDTWIGDLHCASAHFKSKRHNDLYAELIAKKPNWEIDWLTKRTRAFEKSLTQTSINVTKINTTKEDKPKENILEPKFEKSFFEKEPKKDREREKLRDRERDKEKDRDRYKKELSRKTTELRRHLSPDKESNDSNNVSLSDWMKPVDLPVDKSMITLKETVQKTKVRLHNKNKSDEIDEYKPNAPDVRVIKKQRLEEPKPPILNERKDESLHLSNRNKIKLPFIGKMPFAKPITKKPSTSTKDVPNFTVESATEDESKGNSMDSVAIQKMLIGQMISAANEKKVEKQILPIDMDIDDDNENDAMYRAETDSVKTQLNSVQPGNQMHQVYNQPHTTNTLPQDLSTALNMIFPCNEPSSVVPSLNTSINPQIHSPLIHQHHFKMSYDITNNSNISPERKKKKNAPSQRKRRHMKKNMGKDEECSKDDYDDDDDKSDGPIQGPKEEDKVRKSNGNESEGDELAMLGIDAEDMAAQYY